MWRVSTSKKRAGPIGVDIGTRSIKLVQYNADRTELLDAARWDFRTNEGESQAAPETIADAIRRASENRRFRGREAVLCLTDRQFFLQNVRVPKSDGAELDRHIQQEAAKRLPFPVAESEIRYCETADVRQTGAILREVILMAAPRANIDATLDVIESAGLTPVSVDAEPLALLRSYSAQFRREDDQAQRRLFVHVGYSRTVIIIADGETILFAKYVDIGGSQMDEAAAQGLGMNVADAAALRRHNGDRRADQQDPEIARSIAQAVRPVIEKLAGELAGCVRYHSVTFRGKPLIQMVLGGWEATPALAESLASRLNLKYEVSQPFRGVAHQLVSGRPGQWDVAAGLALRFPSTLA